MRTGAGAESPGSAGCARAFRTSPTILVPDIMLLTALLFWSVFSLLGAPVEMMPGRDGVRRSRRTLVIVHPG